MMTCTPTKPMERLHTCAHCCGYIKPYEGGSFVLPTTLSGLPERVVWTHSRCLHDFLATVEAQRAPITPSTLFTNGYRRELPGERK